MNKKSINLGPFGVYLWGGLLAIGGAAWGAGAAITANPVTGTIYLEQLAKGAAREGYIPVVGYCTNTATATGTAAGTSDRLCFRPAPGGAALPTGTAGQVLGVGTVTTTGTSAGTAWQAVNGSIRAGSNIRISKGTDTTMGTEASLPEVPVIHASGLVQGSGTLGGTTNYLIKKTSGGWGSSLLKDDGSALTIGDTYIIQSADGAPYFKMQNASDVSNPLLTFNRQRGTLASPTSVQQGDYLGNINFTGNGHGAVQVTGIVAGMNGSNLLGRLYVWIADGTQTYPNRSAFYIDSTAVTVALPLTLSGLTGKGTGKVLYDTNGSGVIGEKTLAASDVGAEPALPSGTPGQFLMATGTGTAVTTGKVFTTIQESHVAGLTTDLAAKEPTLPTGNVGQVLCTTGTGTGTSTSKGWCANVTGTGAGVSYYTSTPAAVATSGSAGTSTQVSRGDHVHQGDGNDKVGAFSDATPNYLYNIVTSSDSSITYAQYGSGASALLDIKANFGTGVTNVCSGADGRLSNARTPRAHASTHLTTGSDPISLASAGNNGLLSSSDFTALNNRTSTPTASRIPVADGSGYLSSWIPFTTTPGAGAFPKGDANGYLSGWIPFTTTPGNGSFPKGDANGALTGWVKAFKDTATSACAADYSLTGNSWTTVASINCTLASAGKVFLHGLVKYQTTSSSWHYVGVKFILDSTDITESIRFTKTAKLIGSSYDYDSLSVSASATIANTSSHTCYLQFITGISSSDYVYCQGDATNQGAYITALKMYQ